MISSPPIAAISPAVAQFEGLDQKRAGDGMAIGAVRG
jgi:hypothetical protein